MTKPRRCTAGRLGVAVVTSGVLLGACGGGTGRHAASQNATAPMSGAAKATAPIMAGPGGTSPSAAPSPKPGSQRLSSTVFAIAGQAVTFTGETVTAFAQVLSSAPVLLVVARVGFGDDSGIITVPARACHLDPVQQLNLVSSPGVSHRYALPGQHTIRIWARLGCGTDQSVQYSTATVYSYPSAPPSAAGWQRCQPGQLSATLISLGAATGHVGAEIVLRNVSAITCHLYGFPGLQMLGASGAPLPTTTDQGGSFLFPPVGPHLVGLAPAQTASFDLEYADNPAGNPPPPYQQACPAAATLVIIPPDDFTSLRVAAKIAPCNGDLTVSPVVPGTTPIPFS